MSDELLNILLNNQEINIDDLSNILNVSYHQLFELLIGILNENLNISKKYDLKNERLSFDISSYLIEIVKKDEIFNYKVYIKNKSIRNIMNIMKKLNENNYSLLCILTCENLYMLIQMIVDKDKSNQDDNKFNFLRDIIVSIGKTSVLTQVINKYPHYVNLRNNDNTHIITEIFNLFYNSIIDDESISKILYYEKVLNIFLDSDRTKLKDIDKFNIDVILRNIENYINKISNKTDNKYNQLINVFKSIKRKYDKNNLSKIALIELEEKYDIKLGFDEKVINELKIFLKHYSEGEAPIITVDATSTVCIDDGYQITKDDNGNYILKIYIANGMSKIPFYSKINKEAEKRFSTIYLPNGTINMLPSEISNGVYSLNTFGKKSVLEYIIVLDKNADIISYKIYDTYINIDYNLSCDMVNDIINGKVNCDYNLNKSISSFSELAYKLKQKNSVKEKYRLTSDIVKTINGINLDKNVYKNRTPSEVINEELMVLTNYISALICKENNYPYIYRVNQKIEDTGMYKKLIDIMKNRNIADIDIILDGFAKSTYSYIPDRHEGLNLDVYSHSTSPLRRYPDIVNQRILKDLVINKNMKKYDFWANYLLEYINDFNYKNTRNQDFLKEYVKTKHLINRKSDTDV